MPVPLVTMADRSLRTTLRSRGQSRLRTGLVAMLLIALLFAAWSSEKFGAPGLRFFSALVFVNLAFLTMVAISHYATVIAEERAEQTLDVLNLAGFRPLTILLGKSIGLFVTTTLLLAVQLPFATLSITLGGVSRTQVLAAYALLVSYAFLLYGLGLYASVSKKDPRTASRLTAIVALGFLIVTAVGAAIKAANPITAPAGPFESLVLMLADLSTVHALTGILSTGFSGPIASPAIVTYLVGGLALIVTAWLRFQTLGDSGPGDDDRAALQKRRQRVSRCPDYRPHAFYWLGFHFFAGGQAALNRRWKLYGYGIFLAFVILATTRRGRSLFGEDLMLIIGGLAIAIIVEAGVQSGRLLREQIDNRTLYGLILLPVSPSSWLSSLLRGALTVLLVPVTYFGAAFALVALFYSGLESWVGFSLVVLVLLAETALVVYLTMYLSLKLDKGAFPAAVAILLPCHWLVFSSEYVACFTLAFAPILMHAIAKALDSGIRGHLGPADSRRR